MAMLLCAKSFSSCLQCHYRLLAKIAKVRELLFSGTNSKMGRSEKVYQLSVILGNPVNVTVKYTRQDISCNGVTQYSRYNHLQPPSQA